MDVNLQVGACEKLNKMADYLGDSLFLFSISFCQYQMKKVG